MANGIPQTGLIGSEQALRAGLAGSLGALEQSANLGRRDIERGIGMVGGALAGGQRDVGRAIGRGAGQLRGFQRPGELAMTSQAAMAGALGPEEQARAFAEFRESPEQAYIRERGERAVLRGAAATGGLGGGRVLQELQRQGQGLAAQDIQNRFARLGEVAGRGLTAAGQQAQLAGQEAGIIGQLAGQRAGLGAQMTQQQAELASRGGLAGAEMIGGISRDVAGGRTRAGEIMSQQIGSTTSALSNLMQQQGAGIAGTIQQAGSNIANLLSGAAEAQAAGNEQLATLLANIASGQASQMAGLPSIPGVTKTEGALGGIGQLASGIGTAIAAF